MGWNGPQGWQAWRARLGRKPTVAVDGYSTTNAQESALWKSVMGELYGETWAIKLAAGEEATEAAPVAEPGAPSLDLGPCLEPAEVAGTTTPRRARVEPGSGQSQGTRTGAEGPGSGAVTPAPSWSSQSPGTPGTLGRVILEEYDPRKEEVEKYKSRIFRQSQALGVLGQPLAEGMLDMLLTRADIEFELYSETEDRPRQVRVLERMFAFELLSIDGTVEQARRLNAMETMLESRGISTMELRQKVALGVDVARTPVHEATLSPTMPPMPLGAAPCLGPGAPAVPHFPIHGTGMATPRVDPEIAAQFAQMEERLRKQEAELAATRLLASKPQTPPPTGIVELIESQQKLVQAVLDKPKQETRSTIRVEPKVYWPKLGDDGPGGKEVEEFYDKFEDICSLANNGSGMPDKEMLVALKSCLHGSRKKIYENVMKANKEIFETEDGPGKTYFAIKKRLFKFLETSTEKQLRVSNEWHALSKTKGMTALQFEASWEEVHADLEEVGLGKSPLEKFLAYIAKVGPPVSETIRMDRRPRPDNAGGLTTRLPETWEEAHEVLCEIEGVKAGSRAFQKAAQAAGQAPTQPDGGNQQGAFGGGKGKGKDRGGKGQGRGKGDGQKRGVCFEFRDKGTCSRGDSCIFSHSPQDTGRTSTGALTKAAKKAKRQADACGSCFWSASAATTTQKEAS